MGLASSALADGVRVASFHTELSRRGPGLLLRDLINADTPEIQATIDVIAAAGADILVLQDIDYDAGHAALRSLSDLLERAGRSYPDLVALRPNTGMPTGFDLDGDGRAHRARDAQGYGTFNGQGGMALLSRWPVQSVQDFGSLLWRDLPGTQATDVTPDAALSVLRLHSVAAWAVTVQTPNGPLQVLASHATAPVFDGPEDRNGRRNEDEALFWRHMLDGWDLRGGIDPAVPVIFAGTLNVDPVRGEGRRRGLSALLAHPRLQDPEPRGPAGQLETADWEEPEPGNLRVDYILPDAQLTVMDAGVLWPGDTAIWSIDAETAATASDHRLVWVDVSF